MHHDLSPHNPTVRLRVLELFDKLGVTLIDYGIGYADPFWTGKYLKYSSERTNTRNLTHELAHWLVSAPSRRCRQNYGLGPFDGVDSQEKIHAWRISPAAGSREEARASLLGIAIEYHLGGNWWGTWTEHNWTNLWEIVPVSRALERRGLMKNGKPTVLRLLKRRGK